MPKPLPWSHTALDDFVNCPRAYHAKRVAKTVKEEPSEAMLWGNEVHKHFEDRQQYGKPLPDELAIHEGYMSKLEQLPGEGFTERKIAMNRKGQPCGFFDKDVWFRGVIDYTKVKTDAALVVDYKTGKQHSKFGQLKLFALHTFAEYPSIVRVEVKFYWTQTQATTGEVYTRDMIPQLWSEFTPNLRQYAQAFKEDVWQPRQSGLCNGWCPVTDCEFWKPKRKR